MTVKKDCRPTNTGRSILGGILFYLRAHGGVQRQRPHSEWTEAFLRTSWKALLPQIVVQNFHLKTCPEEIH